MKHVSQQLSIDDIQLYVARGALLHPLVYSTFLEMINTQSAKGNICLLPSSHFELYHAKLLRNRNRVA